MPPVLGPRVTIKGGLVILCGWQRQYGPTVGNGQHTRLLTLESFFDDHLHACRSKFLASRDAIDGFQGIRSTFADDDSLASRQAIGFDHHRATIVFTGKAAFDKAHGIIRFSEDLKIGGGYIGLAQQVLAKGLATLQLGRGLGGSKDPQFF